LDNASLLSAINKLAIAGERAGFTVEHLIQLLNAGMTVDAMLQIIAARLSADDSRSSLEESQGKQTQVSHVPPNSHLLN
jgi:hypothetical protein